MDDPSLLKHSSVFPLTSMNSSVRLRRLTKVKVGLSTQVALEIERLAFPSSPPFWNQSEHVSIPCGVCSSSSSIRNCSTSREVATALECEVAVKFPRFKTSEHRL